MGWHTYHIQIINPEQVESINKYVDKVMLIKEMQRDGILLTPQEYTNNIVSYYNTAITLLVFLFILFSFLSYFHLKFLSKEQIKKILEETIQDSKTMEKIIMDTFAGKADDKYETRENVDSLRDIVEEHGKLLRSVEQDEELLDEKVIKK